MKQKIIILSISLIILAGCSNSGSGNSIGGVMRSDDSGKTFSPKSEIDEKTSLENVNVLSIAPSPISSNIVYVGTAKSGLFLSENSGDVWQPLDFPVVSIRNIVINPQNTQNMYVSGMEQSRGTIFRSDNAGEEFRKIYLEPQDGTDITALTLHPHNANTIYAGTSGGVVIRSSDGGQTWRNLFDIKDAGYSSSAAILNISFDAGDDRTIYVLADNNTVYKSRNGGQTFIDLKDLELKEKLDDENEIKEDFSGTLYSLAVNPAISGNLLVGTDDGIYQSVDYGYSWRAVNTIASTDGIPIYALAINPHNTNQIVYAAAKAVYTSMGSSWAITDTTSNRTVSVIQHSLTQSNVVYLGLMKIKKSSFY
jgi:photosystem II stability/assembly factor-like uncharacterized protein